MTTSRPLDSRSSFKLVRSLDNAAAEVAGARAFRDFCTPARSGRRSADHDSLVERARFHLRNARTRRVATAGGEIQVYEIEPEGTPVDSVLLVHGWSGEAAFVGAFADFLRRRGFRAVLMDLPAHGLSGGTQTSLLDCGHAVLEVAEAVGPVRFALGHSIGAMAALLAGEGRRPLPRAYPFDAYVLVAMPDRFDEVTRVFGEEVGLSPAALRAFERRLERIAKRQLAEFTGARLLAATGRPALLLHARDDADVPFADAEAIATAVSSARLEALEGLGHRAILYAPAGVRSAAAFLAAHRAANRPV